MASRIQPNLSEINYILCGILHSHESYTAALAFNFNKILSTLRLN